ncbi:MAG: pyridoxamine 5'-phosphate oxidase family protein [Armatimonadetes bacterium]|nr:pyridoxamine 5'-phosphate oxidase family protein [Armatimonadota bacterium]
MPAESFELPAHIDDYLHKHNVLNVSTCDEEGPWGAAVFYAHEGLKIYFMTAPHTRHGSALVAAGTMAGSIHEDYAGWTEIRGLQMRGRVWMLEDEGEVRAGQRAFFRKYDFAEAFSHGNVPEEIQRSIKSVRLFCFEPQLVLWLDNSAGFGKRMQVYPPLDAAG